MDLKNWENDVGFEGQARAFEDDLGDEFVAHCYSHFLRSQSAISERLILEIATLNANDSNSLFFALSSYPLSSQKRMAANVPVLLLPSTNGWF
jgi:hypothetical protein